MSSWRNSYVFRGAPMPQIRRISNALRFALLLAVAVVSARPARLTRAADRLPETVASPLRGEFKIGKDGRLVLLPVTLGSKTISCLVDTGACLSAFDVTLRELLGQPPGRRNLQTADRLIQVETFDWPDARLD